MSKIRDFSKRITVLRELFEECNILVARKDENMVFSDQAILKQYLDEDSNFIRFCKKYEYRPAIDTLKPLCRLGSPIGYFPANDT